MSKLDDIMDRMGEVACFYPNLDFGYILVSANLLRDLLIEINGFGTLGRGFQSLVLQTCLGQLFVKPEPGLAEDDFILMDISGNRYSYQDFFVNAIAEKILLRGEL